MNADTPSPAAPAERYRLFDKALGITGPMAEADRLINEIIEAYSQIGILLNPNQFREKLRDIAREQAVKPGMGAVFALRYVEEHHRDITTLARDVIALRNKQ